MQYGFGSFSIDIAERQLKRGRALIPVEPKVFDLLTYLVEHPGRLISKQELVDAVWSGSAIGDNSLTRCIHEIRAAIGDSADHPAYLETVRGRGID